MNVFRDGKLFAHWPISTGRPGDETPNGTYLTIEKANPVDMVGPGYNIEVPLSVRITWSGDYLHDAYWSVGEQGFTNVSHGCVNMSPADAETYYKMAVPGDPVRIIGSPRAGDVGQRLDDVVPVLEELGARQRAAQGGPGRPARQHVRQPSSSPPPPAEHRSERHTPALLLNPDIAATQTASGEPGRSRGGPRPLPRQA